MNDRVRELIDAKDTDSLANCSLVDQTVCTDPHEDAAQTDHETTINQNWIKVDKSSNRLDNEALNQQLAGLDCPCIEELEHRIIEIDGEQFNEANRETLLSKLKRSTSPVQMLILN